MPWHIAIDGASEKRLGKLQIGTTRRGIGPAYADKAARIGIRVQDLLDPKILRQKIEVTLAEKNLWLERIYDAEPMELWDHFVPKADGKRAAKDLAKLRRRDPHSVAFCHQSPWHVPIRWFVLFRDEERWLGEQPPSRTLRTLAKSQLCVISSRMEGGANALSEAIVAGVPILASRIKGNTGILGADYPGLFDVAKTRQLAELLIRAETDPAFAAELKVRCKQLAPIFDPANEEQAWADLIGEVRSRKARVGSR